MMNHEPNVEYHHGEIDGTNLKTGQLLICIATEQGLQKGRVYKAEKVTWTSDDTTVIVLTKDGPLKICPADFVLRRTFLEVEIMDPKGMKVKHSFLGFDECLEWSESTGIPYEQFSNFRLVEADPEEGADPVVQSEDSVYPSL